MSGRYLGSPIRYAGGKSLAARAIAERIPVGVHSVVSPFFGGGSVEILLAKERGVAVFGYDIFGMLVNFWQTVVSEPGALADRLAAMEPTKETYDAVRDRLRKCWDRAITIEDSVELAALYWFNHQLSYGPGFLGWASSVYLCPKKYARMVDKIRKFGANIWVARMDFADALASCPDDFAFCDPPYYLGEGSSVFRGIYPQRNFPIHHANFDHEGLRDILLTRKSDRGWLLCYNDCEQIREWYRDCRIESVSWQYTMGQGETRIGKFRQEGRYTKKSSEVLISPRRGGT